MKENMIRDFLTMVTLLVPLLAVAHHGYGGRYDQTTVAEMEGEVVSKLWKNPHIRLTIKDADGELWNLEGGTASVLIRAGFTEDLVRVGDQIRIAGYPSTAGKNEMVMRNILLPSGSEMVMDPSRIGPRWEREDIILGQSPARPTLGDASAPELGLFRTWVTVTRDPDSKGIFPEARDAELVWRYPFTPEALATVQAFDFATQNPLQNYCLGKGMPMIMDQPFAMVFTDRGDDILMQMEEFDSVRVIHIGDKVPAPSTASKFGFSRGHWAGDTLVVETSQISWPYFSQMGVPQTEQTTMVERFTPTEDGSRLNYELVATNPGVFTEPVRLTKYWIYDPATELSEYNCVE